MALQIRRGNTASRVSITPLAGELLFDTTVNTVYVGDGTTQGGIPVGSGGSGGNVNQIIAGNNITLSPTSGNGNVTVGVTASGTGTQIQFNTNGNLDAVTNLAFNKNSNTFTLQGIARINSDGISTPLRINTAGNINNTNHIATSFARGDLSAPLPVQDGDVLLALETQGYTSANAYQSAGGIVIEADGVNVANSTSTMPSKVTIYSTDGNNNNQYLVLDSRGNLQVPGRVTSLVYSDSNVAGAFVTARARGANAATVVPVQVGDTVFRNNGLAYTGTGTESVNGINGWAFSSVFESRVTALPVGTANVPTNIIMRTYSPNAINNRMVFGDNGDLSVFGESGNIYGNHILAQNGLGANTLTLTGLLQSAPATKANTDPGVAGQICWDSDYIYVCTATNIWKRVQLNTF